MKDLKKKQKQTPRKTEKTQINKARDEKRGTTDTTEKHVMEDYYEKNIQGQIWWSRGNGYISKLIHLTKLAEETEILLDVNMLD